MSEANDGGPVVVVVTPGAEASGGSGEGGAVQTPEGVETAEVVTDAAVQIAEIQANRDVDLAIIATEGDAQRAAAYSNEELDQCRLRIAELEGINQGLREALATAEALIPASSPEPSPSPPETPPSQGEAEPAPALVQNAEPVAEPPPQKRRLIRWT